MQLCPRPSSPTRTAFCEALWVASRGHLSATVTPGGFCAVSVFFGTGNLFAHESGCPSLLFLRPPRSLARPSTRCTMHEQHNEDWLALPGHLLRRILELVPVTPRVGSMRSCALVCKAWDKEAAATTPSLKLRFCAKPASLCAYLKIWLSSLTAMEVHCSSWTLKGRGHQGCTGCLAPH